ncbi:zinc finger FYVE domain-containing protein 16-like isoform X1 [Haliotis cracherodii]|uniref:zinc finger FYVE domain-containing protein 16-like isoform X1 n=1 Tax=Haliotis cracherodii TaxID=6455 RepID=UPI0039EB80EE
MDFVDLDKVLDEFEEEEKAADSLTPGQEVRPSGYSEYLESHRDKPWESVAEVPVSGLGLQLGYGLAGKGTLEGSMYDYDTPYDAGGNRKHDFIDATHLANLKKNVTNVEFGRGDLDLGGSIQYGSGSRQDGLQYKNSLSDKEADLVSMSNDLCIEPNSVLTLRASGEAEKEHWNNSDQGTLHGDNDIDNSMYSKHNGVVVNDDFQNSTKGLVASQVTAVQTDALTPRTERELDSVPFPKSDIIVVGHGNSEVNVIANFHEHNSVPIGSQPHAPHQHSAPYARLESVPTRQSQADPVQKDSNGKPTDKPTGMQIPDNVNGTQSGQGHFQSTGGTTVGFDSVSGDIDEDEIDQYLNDSLDSSDSKQQNQPSAVVNTDELSAQRGITKQVIQNPDIVLDIGRSENFMHDQKGNVQYSAPPGAGGMANVPSQIPRSEGTDVTGNQNQVCESLNSKQLQSAYNGSDVLPQTECQGQVTVSNLVPALQNNSRVSSDSRAEQSSFGNQNSTSEESSLSDVGRTGSAGGSPEANSSPSEQGSPPIVGVGARPKDPSAIKKNRPNSLLGLSKINMDSPYNIVHEVSETSESVAQVAEGHLQPESSQSSDMVASEVTGLAPGSGSQYGGSFSQPPGGLVGEDPAPGSEHKQLTNFEIRQQIEQEQRQRMDRMPAEQHNNQLNQQDGHPDDGRMEGETSEDEVVGEVTALAGAGETMDDMPIMRRGEEQLVQPGLNVQAGMPARPHSWSPGSGQIAPPGKLRRPTSLNLPPRGELSMPGDRSPDTSGRMRGIGMMQEEIPEEETAEPVGEECSEGDEGLMEASGVTEEEGSLPMSSEPPPPSIIHSNLGRVAPTWVPDHEAPNCMQCLSKFTFTKRRHHCRACGKVFCSTCCSQKSALAYMDLKEARVCQQCHQLLQSADWSPTGGSSRRSPNPNNPSEYCSTIPPQQQANARAPLPTVLVPVGVLKREGSQRRAEPKQVMFSDGIRPGGDLTELDGSSEARLPPRRTGRLQKKVEKAQGGQSSPKTRRLRGSENARNRCLIPEDGLPPLYSLTDAGDVSLEDNYDPDKHLPQIKNDEAEPIIFAINSNLQVLVKILMLDCCVNRECWSFTTRGLCTVGQDEIVIILECFPDESRPARDIFCHFATMYEEAGKGNTVSDMGHTIFNQSFLDSRDHGGFLYLRPTFQCLQKLPLPSPPHLFGVLLQKWETPWAKVFPLRLLLRLGAEYRYYPCPLVSIRNRKPVFFEIGHTIMNLLADFRNYQYMLPQIRGVHIHMEDKKTVINFPRNRYDELMKMVNSSNEHVMALGSSFSADADSHLVCIQNDEGNYQTQAINIQNKPRKVTGASFVVFNGALKTSSGLRAKSSIVEDGLMVQILPECMVAVKQAIKDMTDYTIGCGSATIDKPEEVVVLQWVDDDKNTNVGVKSPIDKMSLDGVESIHIHNSTDYVGEHRAIRWTDVFFIQNEDSGARWEPVDLSRLAETLASATCICLTQHLDRLKEAGTVKIGLRVTLDTEQVGYEIGSNGEKLADFYMNDLDSGLIPVIHGAVSQSQDGPIVLELVFYVLE